MYYLIIEVSTPTQAMKVKRILSFAGIHGEIVKSIGNDGKGCAHGVKIPNRDFYEASLVLRKNNISYSIKRSDI